MLNKHDHYRKTWSNQIKQSIKVRESLDGKVNQEQSHKDLTIVEKAEGEFATRNEVRKVLVKGFEANNSAKIRENWMSGLRAQ